MLAFRQVEEAATAQTRVSILQAPRAVVVGVVIQQVVQAAGQAAAMVEIAEAVAATLARTVQRKAVTAEVLE